MMNSGWRRTLSSRCGAIMVCLESPRIDRLPLQPQVALNQGQPLLSSQRRRFLSQLVSAWDASGWHLGENVRAPESQNPRIPESQNPRIPESQKVALTCVSVFEKAAAPSYLPLIIGDESAPSSLPSKASSSLPSKAPSSLLLVLGDGS